ncbi:glutamate-1-semialdehyde 2,1-aminomutase [Roseomonas gilardii]|uniref:Glutamate-1-semialdehyde 2,1-aminomutase n=1 Tax=Roseomonas gilardii TaxID=257708 RepID=A0A1L7AAP2_9PROT|nr:glutamate-1-semialdehyde 2,1-aminomutase [Roseomonas gilardii]APT55887.1 glutamate-1-semialdehyde 2,1-aminomutase [Roseomonas gilardii]
MPYPESRRLQAKAHAAIPGGAHTYAKGDDQFPELAPGFIERGEGCHVWDADGNEYIEYSPGLRAVGLGHGHPAVLAAVREALSLGTNFCRPHRLEVECAEAFLSMVPAAEMVKFTKDGSTAVSAAVKIARAATKRDMIAFCADHPFFSYDDWFIGTTAMDAGIPPVNVSLSLRFPYGDIDALRELFVAHPGRIAGVLMESCKYADAPPGYLQAVQALCQENGTLFILDEMINGFRLANGGGQEYYGLEPDLSTFGKALANGFAISALAGKRRYMELGGLQHEGERVFLLSTTHGGETHSLAAAIATMRVYREEPVVETMQRQGDRLATALRERTAALGLAEHVPIEGRGSNLVFGTRDAEGKASQHFRALLMQELIRRGVIGPSLVISYAHDDNAIDRTIEAFEGALPVYARALRDGVGKYLVGPPTKIVYRRYNNHG